MATLIGQITDLHVAAEGPGYGLVDTAARLTEAVAYLNGVVPALDAVVVTGDLVNDGTAAEYGRIAPMLAGISAPVLLLPGNHDDPAAMAEAFPDHRYLQPSATGTYDHVHDVGEVTIACLDTSVRANAHGALGTARLAWLDGVLAGAGERGRPVLVAMHHPPFETGIWWMDAMGLEGAAEFAAVIARHAAAPAGAPRVIAGHIHRSITAVVGGAVASVAPSTGQQIRLDLDGESAGITDEQPQLALHRWTGTGWVTHEAAFRPERSVRMGLQWEGFDEVAVGLRAAGPAARRPAPTDR